MYRVDNGYFIISAEKRSKSDAMEEGAGFRVIITSIQDLVILDFIHRAHCALNLVLRKN